MPKRPWFQFHLSTAIILMFVASGLLWANFGSKLHGPGAKIGWPCCCEAPGEVYPMPGATDLQIKIQLQWEPLMIDLGVAAAILFAVGFFLEWLIRKRLM